MYQAEVEKIVKKTEEKMNTAVESVKKQFATVRTGRAHPSLVDGLKIDYYGTKTPLRQLANISVPEPRLIVIHPWDKSSLDAIEKTLLASDIGIVPVNDGKLLRLSMPQLTEERRSELIKVLHRMTEEGKVSIRNSRHQANEESEKLEKEKKMTEDDKFLTKERVQKLTDDHIKKLDNLLADKEKEIKS